MAEITIEEARIAGQKFKEHVGLTDEQYEIFLQQPFNRRLLTCHEKLAKYRIIAEVISSVRCGAGCKVGQKFVFKAVPNVLLPEESDCALCVKALGPIADLTHGLWDRISEGLDPNGAQGIYASCLDLGVEYGGLGNVKFKIRVEPVSPEGNQ